MEQPGAVQPLLAVLLAIVAMVVLAVRSYRRRERAAAR